MASPSFVDDSQEALELGAILSTNIATLITTNTKSKKRKDFVAKKDCQLCKSFLHVSQDLVIGSGQKLATFWDKVQQHHNKN
jgi:hypothetical protein